MIKSLVVGAVLLGATAISAPAATDPSDGCLVKAGCYFDEVALRWICPDPKIFSLCDAPQGAV